MLGITRFALAMLVVKAHIWPTGQPWFAWQSVFAFYVISGYLMTLVLNEVYGFSLKGIKAFALNRILRLAPSYYTTILVAVFISYFIFPLNNLRGSIRIPSTFFEIFSNATLIGFTSFDNTLTASLRLSPSAWSLSIEVFCYFLLAIGFAKKPKNLLLLLVLGIILNLCSHMLAVYEVFGTHAQYAPYAFQNHYGVLQAGMIPFALGGLSYFYKEKIKKMLTGRNSYILIAAIASCIVITFLSSFMQYVLGLFIMASLIALAVPVLINNHHNGTLKSINKLLGDLSYPIFISHVVIASIIANLFTPLSSKSFGLFIATIIGTTIFSLPLIALERRVQKYRSKIKKSLIETPQDLEPEPTLTSA